MISIQRTLTKNKKKEKYTLKRVKDNITGDKFDSL